MLNKRQQAILQFVYDYYQDNGIPPTLSEIGKATEISSSSVVNYNLSRLIKLGYVERTPRRVRATVLTQRAYDLLGVLPKSENRVASKSDGSEHRVSLNAENLPISETDSIKREVKSLQVQIEHLKRTSQLELEAHLKEQATLTEQICKMRMAIACLIGL